MEAMDKIELRYQQLEKAFGNYAHIFGLP